ncbi:hypothetical protein PR202_gb12048 [Eleusine coracana subsp. coracana]|uniref:CCHC-type domain-containing protein n=1 Tax=Eleusine coracana subsp. coracana TaxID=191504 RepID=A0AAV5EPD4_ELECO|nr:hypothetical protein PR202_gb12048 [Eleusine coracana subsp. coracana]
MASRHFLPRARAQVNDLGFGHGGLSRAQGGRRRVAGSKPQVPLGFEQFVPLARGATVSEMERVRKKGLYMLYTTREMAERTVLTVLERYSNIAVDEAKYLLGVFKKLDSAKQELRTMQAFLTDLDDKMLKDSDVAINLVVRVREVAQEVEDIIDTANTLRRQSSPRTSITGAISKYACFPMYLTHLHKIGARIDAATARMEKILNDFGHYGIVRTTIGKEKIPEPSIPHWRLVHPDLGKQVDVIGFDYKIEQIKSDLVARQNLHLSVLSIVGPGGAGKSTIANKVYGLAEVSRHFNVRAWIIVSHRSERDLLKEIVKCTMGTGLAEELDKMNQSKVKKILHDFLRGRRYLIILDDVWKTDVWDMISEALPDNKNGSRVILTTRNEAIANDPCVRKTIFILELLNEKESAQLLLTAAIPEYILDGRSNNHNPLDFDDLQKVGKDLARKCCGLPLALVVLGGHLSRNLDIAEWRKLTSSVDWHDLITTHRIIGAILDRSYYDMPIRLRSCFMYTTAFPEYSCIDTRLLSNLWVAEGFIPLDRGHTREEIAFRYVNELVQRCMVQVEKRTPCGRILLIKVHDVLRDWGIGRARREGLIKDCHDAEDIEADYSEEKMKVYRMVGIAKRVMEASRQQLSEKKKLNPSYCFGMKYVDYGGDQVEIMGNSRSENQFRNVLASFEEMENIHALKMCCTSLLSDEQKLQELVWMRRLRVLEIGEQSYTGQIITCPHNSFPYLEQLILHDLAVEEWRIEDEAMINLRELTLCKCSNLKCLPEGLSLLPRLKTVKLIVMPTGCQESTVATGLEKMGCQVFVSSDEKDFQHLDLPRPPGKVHRGSQGGHTLFQWWCSIGGGRCNSLNRRQKRGSETRRRHGRLEDRAAWTGVNTSQVGVCNLGDLVRGDMEKRVVKLWMFDGEDFPYWKSRTKAYLLSQGRAIWEIIDQEYAITQDLNIASAGVNYDRVAHLDTAHAIWDKVCSYHEGTNQVKSMHKDSYNRQYQTFAQKPGESLDDTFRRFEAIVCNLRACGTLVYNDNDRAKQLLYSLDENVWGVKIAALEETADFNTLNYEQLYSKLKSHELSRKSRPNLAIPASSMALLSSSQKVSHSDASYGTNPSLDKSSLEFALSSLVAAFDEQMECIPDEELSLLTRKFRKFYNNQKERRGGGSRTCFECGDPGHFIADCPKKKKAGYRDNNTEDFKQKKNRFYKKGKNSKKFAKAIARTCVAALSDVDLTSSEGLSSSEEEVEKPRVKRKDDFTGLCFMAKNDHDTDSESDSDTSEVPPTLDELSSELDHLRDVLLMQDDKLHSAVRESIELKSKLESADFKITSLRSKLACEDIVVECESYQVVMSDLAQRESVHAQVASQLESALKELDEFKARPTLLGACQKCPKLTDELEAQSLKVKELESKLLHETRSKVLPPSY